MKKLAFFLLALIPFAAGAKEYTIKTDRAITSISNSSEADIELIYSPTAAGTITYNSPEATAPLRVTVNPMGKLTVETLRKKNYKISNVKVYYSGKISGISNSGTGDIEAKVLNAPVDLTINNSGTGDVDITDLNVKSIKISNSGTGDVDIDGGKSVSVKINNSGTGDVKAKISSAECEISNSGTGDVTGVRASSKKMKLSNCGTGKIVIKKQKVSGVVEISPNCDRNIRFVN